MAQETSTTHGLLPTMLSSPLGSPHCCYPLQELSRVALRQKQQREQHYAHINGIKIHNQWCKIMRMAKVEELRKQVEILSQNHEREVDRKDALVQVKPAYTMNSA
eukprot:GHUV01052090.1.p2 GENE.GHUV01052090.1~~GHUV01052090.1.p2  ORF type:complete len:105 (+),score=32.73 GHUV01052090.1:268-582(+)